MTLKELRDKLRAKLAELRQNLATAKTEKRALNDTETATKTRLEEEVRAIKGQIAVLEQDEELENEERSMAPETQRQAPATGDPDDPQQQPQQRQTADPDIQVRSEKYETGDAIGALVSARYRFGQNQDLAKRWAEKQYGSGSKQARAMQQSVFTAGGATIAENFVGSELIELLRAKSAVRRAGARALPLVNGSATLPKITGGSTAGWGVEGENIQASEMTTGEIKLVEKKLTALVPVSNDLLKNSNLQVDRLIRDDMSQAAANAEDIGFLKGDGTAGKPKGAYYWLTAAGRGNSAGTTLAFIRTDVRTSKNRLGNNNAPEQRRAWFMHSRDLTYLGTEVVDANSNLVWPTLANGDGAAWQGGKVYQDNNISIVLGSGNKSEIYYLEMSECFIGDSGALELELFLNATYVDANGNLRSGISRDESVVRLIRKSDFAMRHPESGYVLEAVAYGA